VTAGARTRLAPTPSGSLHAGNACSFLLAWLFARTSGGSVLLRIEDVDLARARPDLVEAIFRDLVWLGLDWDEGPAGPGDSESPYRQSSRDRQERYGTIWEDWRDRDLLYPCRCSRAELRSDAPQVSRIDDELPVGPAYSGRCRGRSRGEVGERDAWRLRLPTGPSEFSDRIRGPQRVEALDSLGDPVLRRGDGIFAYHLAACADDADQGIDLVVRGRDLLPFSHLHAHLHRLLGNPPPTFAHHPLLGDAEGNRLAKRADSSSLSAMREAGLDSRSLVGRFAPILYPDAGLDGSPLRPGELVPLGLPGPGFRDVVGPDLTPGAPS
jgi:glutamyl-tRNA synthetase